MSVPIDSCKNELNSSLLVSVHTSSSRSLQESFEFPLRIRRGLLKHASQGNSDNHKAQVFRAICKIAKEDGDVSLAKVRENPRIQEIFHSARQVEIHALKKYDKVIENVDKGNYRLTPLGKLLAEVYDAEL